MFRLFSLNLNYRVAKHGAWKTRRALITAAIAEAGVDVVAFQAVERARGSDQASELGELLGYRHVTFVPATTSDDVACGSALLSRTPLADVAVRTLSRRRNEEDTSERVVIRAGIDANGFQFTLYNAHFSWIEAQALDNVRETLDFCGRGASLLLGDLNNGPDSAAVTALKRGRWIDVWPRFHPDDPGFTFQSDRLFTRIDYALATEELLPRIHSIERVISPAAMRERYSDHLGLLVTLSDGPLLPP